MKAMILCAGRGERMRPLTDKIPKPLLKVGPHRLVEYHLQALLAAGIRDVIINVSHLADTVINALGSGERYGLNIQYSQESEALETAGGIIKALPLLGDKPFWVINGDVFTDFQFSNELPEKRVAKLFLVDNPGHHPEGDFSIQKGDLTAPEGRTFTFSGIGIYRREFFADYLEAGHCRLASIIRSHLPQHSIAGEHYSGLWLDVGTPERLALAESSLAKS